MKQNIGMVDRYVRLVTGILALNYASGTIKRKQVGRGLLLSLGAMKVAEGVTGWCPATQLYETFTKSRQNQALDATSAEDNDSNPRTQQKQTHKTHASKQKKGNHDENIANSFEIQ